MSEEAVKSEEAVVTPTFSEEFEEKFNEFVETAENALSLEEVKFDHEGTICSVTFSKGAVGMTFRVHQQTDHKKFSVEGFVVGLDGKRTSNIFTSKGYLKKNDCGNVYHSSNVNYSSSHCSQGSGLSAAQGILIEMQNLAMSMMSDYAFMQNVSNNALVRLVQGELAKQHAKANVVSAEYEDWSDALIHQELGESELGKLKLKGKRKTDEEAHKELLAIFRQERPEGPFGEEFIKNLGYGAKEKPEKDNEIDESFVSKKKEPMFRTFFAWLKGFVGRVLHFGRKKDDDNVVFTEKEYDEKDDKLENLFESPWVGDEDEEDRKAKLENPRDALNKAIKYEIRMSAVVQKDKKTSDRRKQQ